jgi:hypothetical protein
MSKTPREQKLGELNQAIGNRDDYESLLRLPAGAMYQGVLVTPEKQALWRRARDRWATRVQQLQREYDAMASDKKKSGRRPR